MKKGQDFKMKQVKRNAYLNFVALTDPLCLLEALMVHRSTHNRLLVRKSNLNIYFEYDQGSTLSGDIRDESFSNNFYFSRRDDLTIKSANLPLALRIAQFAINEGYIEIVSDPNIPQEEVTRINNSPIIKEIHQAIPYNIGYYGGQLAIGTYGWPGSRAANALEDLSVTVAESSHLITGSRDYFFQESLDNIFPQEQVDYFEEVISNLVLDNIGDIWSLIEKPTIFLRTIDAVRCVIERDFYSDLILFLSRASRRSNSLDLISEVWQRSINLTINTGDIFMDGGSKYNISGGQQGAVGDNAKVEDFSQIQDSSFPHDLGKLIQELETLEKTLEGIAKNQKQREIVSAISQAKKEANSGNKCEVSRSLKKAGIWALETATKIGMQIAADAIRKSLGIT